MLVLGRALVRRVGQRRLAGLLHPAQQGQVLLLRVLLPQVLGVDPACPAS